MFFKNRWQNFTINALQSRAAPDLDPIMVKST